METLWAVARTVARLCGWVHRIFACVRCERIRDSEAESLLMSNHDVNQSGSRNQGLILFDTVVGEPATWEEERSSLGHPGWMMPWERGNQNR